MKTIEDVIIEMRSGSNSYWNAVMISQRCGGVLMVHEKSKKFAVRLGNCVYDIEGRVRDDGFWAEWWVFELNNPEIAKELKEINK